MVKIYASRYAYVHTYRETESQSQRCLNYPHRSKVSFMIWILQSLQEDLNMTRMSVSLVICCKIVVNGIARYG